MGGSKIEKGIGSIWDAPRGDKDVPISKRIRKAQGIECIRVCNWATSRNVASSIRDI